MENAIQSALVERINLLQEKVSILENRLTPLCVLPQEKSQSEPKVVEQSKIMNEIDDLIWRLNNLNQRLDI